MTESARAPLRLMALEPSTVPQDTGLMPTNLAAVDKVGRAMETHRTLYRQLTGISNAQTFARAQQTYDTLRAQIDGMAGEMGR